MENELSFIQIGLGQDGRKRELLGLTKEGKIWYFHEISGSWRKFPMDVDVNDPRR